MPKNWCLQTVVVEKTPESPLDCKEIQLVYFEDQPWVFFGGNDAKAEAPVLWLPDAQSWLTVKDPDAGKDWRWEEKGVTEDEMVGWHHWLNGNEFEQPPGDGNGQGSLVCLNPWGCKELDTTLQLNNYTEGLCLKHTLSLLHSYRTLLNFYYLIWWHYRNFEVS